MQLRPTSIYQLRLYLLNGPDYAIRTFSVHGLVEDMWVGTGIESISSHFEPIQFGAKLDLMVDHVMSCRAIPQLPSPLTET
jgi:hypothetical protein